MSEVVHSVVANVHVRPLPAGSPADTVIGWSKWFCFAACIIGVIFVAVKLAINNRRGEGEDHAKALAAVLVAAILAGAAGSLIQALQ